MADIQQVIMDIYNFAKSTPYVTIPVSIGFGGLAGYFLGRFRGFNEGQEASLPCSFELDDKDKFYTEQGLVLNRTRNTHTRLFRDSENPKSFVSQDFIIARERQRHSMDLERTLGELHKRRPNTKTPQAPAPKREDYMDGDDDVPF